MSTIVPICPSFRSTKWTIGANVCISNAVGYSQHTDKLSDDDTPGSATEWIFDVRLLLESVSQQEVHSKAEPFGRRRAAAPDLLSLLLHLHWGWGALNIGGGVELRRGGRRGD